MPLPLNMLMNKAERAGADRALLVLEFKIRKWFSQPAPDLDLVPWSVSFSVSGCVNISLSLLWIPVTVEQQHSAHSSPASLQFAVIFSLVRTENSQDIIKRLREISYLVRRITFWRSDLFGEKIWVLVVILISILWWRCSEQELK